MMDFIIENHVFYFLFWFHIDLLEDGWVGLGWTSGD